ncbi:hypothetical protein HPB47_023861 [Ixodes persulcatus]|uniref:Uncharacterized protein n=1 Tax=Ixodes persulcatus TaxID=34615 RepID=A0AC60Q634_IXOPE|nr:hypothetical protein HPB47_023861 [Ixodes persulcatus]
MVKEFCWPLPSCTKSDFSCIILEALWEKECPEDLVGGDLLNGDRSSARDRPFVPCKLAASTEASTKPKGNVQRPRVLGAISIRQDNYALSAPTVCRVIGRVTDLIALELCPELVKLPGVAGSVRHRVTMHEFYTITKFPGVTVCIDCAHARIKSPGGDDAEVFRNRKGHFSLNVKAPSTTANYWTTAVLLCCTRERLCLDCCWATWITPARLFDDLTGRSGNGR